MQNARNPMSNSKNYAAVFFSGGVSLNPSSVLSSSALRFNPNATRSGVGLFDTPAAVLGDLGDREPVLGERSDVDRSGVPERLEPLVAIVSARSFAASVLEVSISA